MFNHSPVGQSQLREQKVKLFTSSAAIGHDQCREGIEQKAEPHGTRRLRRTPKRSAVPSRGGCGAVWVAVTIRKIDPYHSGWWFQPTPLKNI